MQMVLGLAGRCLWEHIGIWHIFSCARDSVDLWTLDGRIAQKQLEFARHSGVYSDHVVQDLGNEA